MTNYTSAAEQYGRIPRSHCYQGTTDEWSSQEQLRTSDGLGKDFGPESLIIVVLVLFIFSICHQ